MPKLTVPQYICEFCESELKSAGGKSRHYAMTERCFRMLAEAERKNRKQREKAVEEKNDSDPDLGSAAEGGIAVDKEMGLDTTVGSPLPAPAVDENPIGGEISEIEDFDMPEDLPFTSEGNRAEGGRDGTSSTSQGKCRGSRFAYEAFPGPAGASIGIGTPKFETLQASPATPASHLLDPELWELARWLMSSGLSAGARESFFKLKKNLKSLPWKTEREFARDIDQLPHGPDWRCIEHDIEGDLHTETVEIWMRNPVDCVHELLGNAAFADYLHYAPCRVFQQNTNGTRERVFGEMWSANWWWDLQHILSETDPTATIVPIILASDKTQLSVFSGDKAAWPVYLTIGNIPKFLRRKTSLRATILIGYLPVPKLGGFSKDDDRRNAKNALFHRSMSTILAPLVEAGKTGVDAVCADSQVRHIYPIVSSYIADFPEQCLIAACSESSCPICEVRYNDRGTHQVTPSDTRNHQSALAAMANYQRSGYENYDFLRLNLRPLWPFWAALPHMSIYKCFTPDVLHQLHKGLFKDHLVKWCSEILKKPEIDRRFKAVPLHPGIHHFSKGISHVSQWTGREHREMEKIFLPIVSGAAAPVVKSARALLDFIYVSHYSFMSESDLQLLTDSLRIFHSNKNIFTPHVGRVGGFNGIPKLHMVSHEEEFIRSLGTPDGFSSEQPERYHIDYAKECYRHTNRVNPTRQMTVHLQRSEAVRLWTSYLAWSTGFHFDNLPVSDLENSISHFEEPASKPALFTSEPSETTPTQSPSAPAPCYDALTSPDPSIKIAKRPVYSRKTSGWIVQELQAADFVSETNKYLAANLPSLLPYRQLSHHDVFDLWTRFSLLHSSHQLLALDSLPSESIQVRPRQLKANGSASSPGFSTTVLLLDNPNAEGLARYRPAQVRAIFKLPAHFRQHLPSHLVYVEYFSHFSPSLPRNHLQLYTSTPSKRSNGQRVTAIVPIDRIKLTCHLVPQFNRIHEEEQHSEDPLNNISHFYVNEFSSHIMYAYMREWKALSS